MALTDVAMVGLVAGMLALVAAAVARRSRGLALGVLAGVSLWLLATAVLASRGVLSEWTARPPRLLFVPLTALVTVVLLGRTRVLRALVAATPRAWPIAAQTFRIAVELLLFALHAAGRAPLQITFAGRNFDILVGLTAPVIAWLVLRQRATPTLVVVWNVVGLAVLLNTIFTVLTSVPGPQHLDWPGQPFTAIATWPVIWLPAFLAPLAIFLHVVSLQQHIPRLGAREHDRP